MKYLLIICLFISANIQAQNIIDTYSVTSGGTLYLDTQRGAIVIDSHNSETVLVDIEIQGNDAQDFSVSIDKNNNDLRIKGTKPGSNWGWNRDLRVKFNITVPENYNVDLDTAGGSIKVKDLTGNITANTSGGSIKIGEITGDVDVNTSGGSIKIARVFGEIQANTSGGSIKAEFAQQITQSTKLSTSGGSVTAYVPADMKANVKASTSGGRVTSDFEIDGETTKRRINGTINGGGPKLVLRTSGGSVKLKKS